VSVISVVEKILWITKT